MNTTRRIATVVAGAALIAPLLLASAPAAMAGTTSDGCRTGALPVTVLGSPGVKAQDALGLYLWHGATGYSVRATHPGHARVTMSGSITVSRTIHDVQRVALERNDSVQVGPYRHTLVFRFNNYGYIDGFNFTADCSRTVHVVVRIGKTPAAPAQVFLGKHRINPTSVPFTIERAHDATPAKIS